MSSFGKYNTSEILLNSFFGKVGNAFGLIPMFPASTRRKKWFFRAYTFCFYFLAIGFIVYLYYLKQLEIKTNSMMSYLVFIAFWPILHLLLLVTGVCGAIMNESHWRKMLENISRFDEILRRKVLFEHSKVRAHIISYVIGYCVIIIEQIIESIGMAQLVSKQQVYVIYTIEFIIQSQMLWMTTLIHELCSCIKRRYDYLTGLLTATFNVRRREVDVEIDLYEIKQMYRMLHDTVEHFNRIFGMFGIFFLTNSLFTLLEIIISMIVNQSLREMHMWTFPVYLIIQNVYTLIIILSCDRVEKSAKKLLVTSYRLQVKDRVDNITKECIDLSKVIKDLSPEFTALGLFKINQRLIPAFLSSMASYVIVLLQFNVELDPPQ